MWSAMVGSFITTYIALRIKVLQVLRLFWEYEIYNI